MAGPILELKDLGHGFGDHPVLHQVNLKIQRGEIIALVGPSGCGKSTLLRAIVGTHPPREGKVLMWDGDRPCIVDSPGRERGIVYQRYSLFPHLTAQENVAYGLMVDETETRDRLFRRAWWRNLRKQHMEQAAEMLERMKLEEALHKYPPEMSGGMCQRVAIAQALIMKPSILLLDEPFGALDEATREELQRILLGLYAENEKAKAAGEEPAHTVLIVTHEINEAIFVSNRLVGLSQYWNWQERGRSSCPGATIVYDQATPIFSPDDDRDFLSFRDQKDEILKQVFHTNQLQDPSLYVQAVPEEEETSSL